MEDKRMKAWTDPELRFTKEDREQVFREIHTSNAEKKQVSFILRLVPLTVSLVVASVFLFLFLPSLLKGDLADQAAVAPGEGTKLTGAGGNDPVITALLSIKDEEDRVPVNLLFAYHREKQKLKVLSIPRDTYVQIQGQDGEVSFDKLTFAYWDTGGAEGVRATVSELFDVPVDYYAVMDLDEFSAMIESVGGMEYDLREDLLARAISRSTFEFQKGMNQLSGEEFLALVMDATVENTLGNQDLLQLMTGMMTKVVEEAALAQFQIEGDIPADEMKSDEWEFHSIQTVSMLEGKQDTLIDEKYFMTFEDDFLQSVREELIGF